LTDEGLWFKPFKIVSFNSTCSCNFKAFTNDVKQLIYYQVQHNNALSNFVLCE